MPRLKKRGEFVRASHSGLHASTPGVVLQAYKRGEAADSAGPPRVGFTTSKKVGNAVARNRARRRLRALAEAVLAPLARPGLDYVLVGRTATVTRPFPDLVRDLEDAIARVHAGRGRRRRPSAPRESQSANLARSA
ncbi:MAG: ribonuclease P protein component [Alphaproteobacteria bacterium]|nr:ribonuclease P protein component [Alphaproteobacteria bacterium]MCB9929480.1 ribonuclease P protein component [Alphaproteobacteria bacterium]